MTGAEREAEDAASVSGIWFIEHEPPVPAKTYDEIKDIFHSGLIALHVLKPLRTMGIVSTVSTHRAAGSVFRTESVGLQWSQAFGH